MSRFHLLILWVLTLIAGIIFFNAKGSRKESTQTKTLLAQGDEVVPRDLIRTASGLRLSQGEEKTTITINENSWGVAEQDDFSANLSNLSSTFDTLRKLKITQGLAAPSEAWDRFGLNPDAERKEDRPKEIAILAEDGSAAVTIFVGKSREGSGPAAQSGGRFIRLSGDDQSIYVVDESFSSIPTASDSWISKKLPVPEAVLKVRVKPAEGESWTTSRETAIGDMLLEGLPEDQETVMTQTASLKNIFNNSTFMELLSNEDVEKRGAKDETRLVTIETASGITYDYTLIPEKKEDGTVEKNEDTPEAQDNRNYIVRIKLTSGPKTPKKPADDADEATKAGYQALLANMKSAEKTFNKHKKSFENRHFLVANFTVSGLLKEKSQLFQKKQPKAEVASPPVTAPSPASPPASPPKAPNFIPGGPSGGGTPGANPARKRIEAVTPPIAIPQAPKKKAEEAKATKEGE
jgi:hypothetical protein